VDELAIDVGPELLKDAGNGIDPDIGTPFNADVSKASFTAWIVETRYAGGSTGSHDLAEVESVTPRVGARNRRATQGVGRALEHAAAAQGVVPVVFVGERGDDELHQEIGAGLVDCGVPEIAAISHRSLPKLRRRLSRHGGSGNHRRNEDGRVVKGVVKGCQKLLLHRHRRENFVCAYSVEIRQEAGDALGLRITSWDRVLLDRLFEGTCRLL